MELPIDTIERIFTIPHDVIAFDGRIFSSIVYTHHTQFHSDDIFASALIYLLYEKQHPDVSENEIFNHLIYRRVSQADAMYAVFNSEYPMIWNLVYDIGQGEFDHHTAPRETRPLGGVAYSSFGKLWRAMYREFGYDETHYQILDNEFVQFIDANDNHGVRNPLSLAIHHANPIDISAESYDQAFMKCLKQIAIPILRYCLNDLTARQKWYHLQQAKGTFDNITDYDTIIFSEPVNRTWVSQYTTASAMIYPHRRGGWALEALSQFVRYDESKNRWECPLEYRNGSMSHEQLRNEGIIFAHADGFLVTFNTKENAITFAQKYVRNQKY